MTNVKRLPASVQRELEDGAQTRSRLLTILDKNRAAYEAYINAQKDLKKTEASIIKLMLEIKEKTVQVLSFIFTLLPSPIKPKVAKIGVKEVLTALADKGLQQERDLIEDIYNELMKAKTEKNLNEVKGKVNNALDVQKHKKQATG